MRAHTYGTRVRLGQLIRSQRTANLLVCTNRIGVTRRNQTAGVDLPNVLHTGVIATSIRTREGTLGRAHRITGRAHVARVVLLQKITAKAITAKATASTRRRNPLVGNTVILGLVLNGKRVPLHPKRDMTIAVPGLCKIVFNHQVRIRHQHRISIRVTAVRVIVGASNSANLPAGHIVIGRSTASVRVRNR